jgi:hypothetical protein
MGSQRLIYGRNFALNVFGRFGRSYDTSLFLFSWIYFCVRHLEVMAGSFGGDVYCPRSHIVV